MSRHPKPSPARLALGSEISSMAHASPKLRLAAVLAQRFAAISCRLLLCLGACLLGSRAAHAQAISGVRPEAHLDLGVHGDPGLGLRVDIPLVPEGILTSVHDELALSPGVDLLIRGGGPWLAVPVALQWNFYLEHRWSLFPEAGAALVFADKPRGKAGLGLDFLLALGARYHFSERNAFVVRLGWPIGLQLGITF